MAADKGYNHYFSSILLLDLPTGPDWTLVRKKDRPINIVRIDEVATDIWTFYRFGGIIEFCFKSYEDAVMFEMTQL